MLMSYYFQSDEKAQLALDSCRSQMYLWRALLKVCHEIVIHSRITLRKGANPNGELSRRRKSGAYGIRFTAVFYASTIFPAAENRGTILRLARENRQVVRHLSLERNVGYAIVYTAPRKNPRRCDRRVRPAVK